MFLGDAWCLGVKNVSYIRMLPENYRSAAEEIQMRGEHEPAPVACARKLVAGAVNYAGSLGFSPHRDFKKAWRVMGGVDPDECDCDYSFGENGKPHYFQGPHDTPAFTNRVITTLTRRLGEGNFHLTLVPSGIPFDFFDDF